MLGAKAVELHTGRYADAPNRAEVVPRARRIERSRVPRWSTAGMILHAGHGLNYSNVGPVARIPGMAELNIGHSIVSRAVFFGMDAGRP